RDRRHVLTVLRLLNGAFVSISVVPLISASSGRSVPVSWRLPRRHRSSALRFGLSVLLGVTARKADGFQHGPRRSRAPWRVLERAKTRQRPWLTERSLLGTRPPHRFASAPI